MTLRKKMLISFMICNVLLAVVGGIGLFGMLHLKKSLQGVTADARSVRALLTISEAESFSRAAIRTLLIPALPADRVENQKKYIRDAHESVTREAVEYAGLQAGAEEQAAWKEFQRQYEAASQATEAFLKLSDDYRRSGSAASYAQLLELNLGRQATAFNSMRVSLDRITERKMAAVAKLSADSDKTARLVFLISGIVTLLGICIGLLVSVQLTRSTLRQMGGDPSTIQHLAQAAAGGDLTARGEGANALEGSVQHSFINMLHQISGIVGQITKSSCSLAASAVHLHDNTDNIALSVRDVEQQTIALGTASEEMAATSSDIARNCHLAAENSTRACDNARAGVQVVQETIEDMKRIADRVKTTAETVRSLGTRSEQIGEIIGTIEDIADQTNLLALNAAIEAARAGDQGRGFAVVADEVRALAERTTRATHEISVMIKSIQKETEDAVQAMRFGVTEVDRGMATSRKSEEALEEILSGISDMTMQINQIATAAEEQTATTQEIANNIHLVSEALDATTNSTQSSSTTVGKLTVLAEELLQSVRKFRVEGDDLLILELAKNDHMMFVSKVRSGVMGQTSIEATELPNHHTCRFGKWYDTEGKELCGSLQSFREIDHPHEQIHSMAKEALLAARNGNREKAEQLMTSVETASKKVVDKLADMRKEYQSVHGGKAAA